MSMIEKRPIFEDRVRRIKGGFSFIPHRFLAGGFLSSLSKNEILLYFFLILAGDRQGLSFYRYDKICSLLELEVDEYEEAKDGLIEKSLIAFDGFMFQVLELPGKPVLIHRKRLTEEADCPASLRMSTCLRLPVLCDSTQTGATHRQAHRQASIHRSILQSLDLPEAGRSDHVE